MIRVARQDEAAALLALWREADAFPSFTDTLEGVTTVLGRDESAVLVAEDSVQPEVGRFAKSIAQAGDAGSDAITRE